MAFSRKPQSMNQLLKEFMKRIPHQTELKRGMVLHLWPSVVGPNERGIKRPEVRR